VWGPLYIEAGRAWENGYIESFDGMFRDELLAHEVFCSVKEAEVIGKWCLENSEQRRHSSLGI
jgi:hypothetical protein